jgi:hypothetical protein
VKEKDSGSSARIPSLHQAVFVGQVLSPTSAYSGQKLTRLVSTNTAPRITNTKPRVPVTVPVKYNTPNTTARITRIIRSTFPMFFFIVVLSLVFNFSHTDKSTQSALPPLYTSGKRAGVSALYFSCEFDDVKVDAGKSISGDLGHRLIKISILQYPPRVA